MKLKRKGNTMHVLRDYDYHDRKQSGKWNRQQRSRTHSRRKRSRRG